MRPHLSYTIDVRREVEVKVGRGNRIRCQGRRGRRAKERGEEEIHGILDSN